jgi:DNA invertase Pin-like site-specific DNA recombinase
MYEEFERLGLPSKRAANKNRGRQCKLTADQAETLRAKYAMGHTYRELAAESGVSISTISLLIRGETWKEAQP